MSGSPSRHWPRPEAYPALEHIGTGGIAWEWLRRDPGYRRLAPSLRRTNAHGLTIIEAAAPELQARWHCLHVADAALPAGEARILWSEAADPTVLRVAASPAPPGYPGVFDMERWSWCTTIVRGVSAGEHLLFEQVGCRIRLDIVEGSVLSGPVALRYDLSGVADLAPPLATLRAFHGLLRTGAFPGGIRRPKARLGKAIEALRVHDALEQGASLRDIGVMLFGIGRVAAEWEAPGEAMKSLCRRRIVAARAMAAGGWRRLLR